MNPYSPCGSTFVINANATSQQTYVTSTQPVNTYHVVNTGTAPVQLRLSITSNTAAVFPTPGSPQIGSIIAGGAEELLVVPSAINGQAGGPAGFNSNISFSVIAPTGTTSANVFITPVLAF